MLCRGHLLALVYWHLPPRLLLSWTVTVLVWWGLKAQLLGVTCCLTGLKPSYHNKLLEVCYSSKWQFSLSFFLPFLGGKDSFVFEMFIAVQH